MKPAIVAAFVAALTSSDSWKHATQYRVMSACSLVVLVVAGTTGNSALYLSAAILLSLTLCCRRQPPVTLLPAGETSQVGWQQVESDKDLRNGMAGTILGATAESAATETCRDIPPGFSRIIFCNKRERRFSTATGSLLAIGAGAIKGALRMALHPGQNPGDEMDTLYCCLQLADSAGYTWECRQFMLPFLLTDPIEPGAVLPPDGFFFCSEAPAPWRQALESNRLITGVQNLLDTRDVGQVNVSDTTYQIYFKQQRPLVDVAYLDSAASFIVRISRIIHDIHLDGEFAGSAVLPPFCYAVPAEELLFLDAPHHYYSYHEEWYAMEDGERKRSPLFTGLHRKDTPQPLVRLVG